MVYTRTSEAYKDEDGGDGDGDGDRVIRYYEQDKKATSRATPNGSKLLSCIPHLEVLRCHYIIFEYITTERRLKIEFS